MADKYDVHVVGIDLSINMISFALERAIGLKYSVEFEVTDCTKKTYPDGSFDVIYSRDTILHIQVFFYLSEWNFNLYTISYAYLIQSICWDICFFSQILLEILLFLLFYSSLIWHAQTPAFCSGQTCIV